MRLSIIATAITVAAERAFLRRLEGGCQVPIAAYAELHAGDRSRLRLHGRVIALGGDTAVEGREEAEAPDDVSAAEVGTRLAERLLQMGAAEVLAGCARDSHSGDQRALTWRRSSSPHLTARSRAFPKR